MTVPSVSAIVLAGGRSRRFGRDKLAEPVGGRPLLLHAIDAVSAIASDVVVVVGPGATLDLPPGARLAHDPTPYEGPLAGLLAGLLEAREPLVLLVGGDMPNLDPDVLGSLIRALDASAADLAVLEHRGRPQPLPMALRNGAATTHARRLVAEGERRLGAILDRLAVRVLAEGEWRPLDPNAATLRDIDVPDDLR
jgi:molybdopterin-guanine dinucleotide biosynthesis protein A